MHTNVVDINTAEFLKRVRLSLRGAKLGTAGVDVIVVDPMF